MTLSGEVRYRPRASAFPGPPRSRRPIDNYLLQRYLVGADVRSRPAPAFFVELQSGIVNGKLRSPRPSDRNSLDLHQAFVELRPFTGNDSLLTLKVGRQALAVGSTRLISASPGLNVKRSFDGVGATVPHSRSWTLVGRGRAARGTAERRLRRSNRHRGNCSGESPASRRSPRFERGQLATYYLGLDRTFSLYAQGGGRERRHTIGVKWSRRRRRRRPQLRCDLAQWGELGGSSIRAWAFATETGYGSRPTGWQPRLSVRADVASGDDDPAQTRDCRHSIRSSRGTHIPVSSACSAQRIFPI